MEYVVLAVFVAAIAAFVGTKIFKLETLFGVGCILTGIGAILWHTLNFYS